MARTEGTNGPADMRPGEVAVPLPEHADAAIYFIGRIRTPWPTRSACPKRGDPVTGPACAIEVDDPWRPALRAIGRHPRLQILYWMHLARRDLVLQNPRSDGVLIGTFAILKLIDATIGLRVADEEEEVGLDLTQHGERGYIMGPGELIGTHEVEEIPSRSPLGSLSLTPSEARVGV